MKNNTPENCDKGKEIKQKKRKKSEIQDLK